MSPLEIKHPWSGYCGNADHYFVASSSEERAMLSAEISSEKISRIESIEATIIKQIRDKIPKPSKLQILALLPPDQFEGENTTTFSGISCHMKQVESLIVAIEKVRNLFQSDFEVTYALHPRTFKSIETMRSQFPDKAFSTEDVTKELASTDLLISYGSALNQIALELNIDIINWDIFEYGYTTNPETAGSKVVHVESQENFINETLNLLKNSSNQPPKSNDKYTNFFEALEVFMSNYYPRTNFS